MSARLRAAATLVALACIASVGVREAEGLRCYRAKQDCFPSCTYALDACEFDWGESSGSSSSSSSDVSDTNTSTMCTESDAGTPTWVCARNFEACNTTAECTLGLALPTANCSDAGADPDFCIETCSGEQDVCVDEFRHPQNSRFGKSAVWGFEEVHVRGCASTCEALNQSADTGIGVTCCTDDLCNTSSRASVAPVLLVALCIIHAIALAPSTP